MKVLYITNMYPTSDRPYYGIFVKEQIEFLRKNEDIEIKVLILNNKNNFKKYFNFKKILKFIQKFNPDIIHVHYGLTGLPLLLLYPFIYKIKIVTTYHGSDINGNMIVKFISMLVAKLSTINIAVSQEIYKKLKKYQKNVIWIPCGVDGYFLKNDKKYDRKNSIIFPSSPKRDVKNYSLFQKVVSILKNKYQLQPKIIIFENKSRTEVKKALLTSKCLLLTSKSEGSPQVIKEAICCDIPIVSTGVGDVPLLLDSLTNCYISDNAEEMAEKVVMVLNANLIKYPDKVKNKLTNQFVCKKIYHLYRLLVILPKTQSSQK